MCDKVVDIQLIDVIDHGSNVKVVYSQTFENGDSEVISKNVKYLGGYYDCLNPKPIKSSECLGKVYCGIIKNVVRVIFVIKLRDGSVQLIQVKERSREYLKLLELCRNEGLL